MLFITTLILPVGLALQNKPYINWGQLLIFETAMGFIWLLLVIEFVKQTVSITCYSDSFTIRKIGQRTYQYPYTSITGHLVRNGELIVYLPDNWFQIRADEFEDYNELYAIINYHSQAVPFKKVMTLRVRNRLRWAIVGLTLLVAANIGFGFLAYNSEDAHQPVQLTALTDTVRYVSENRNKGRLVGFTFRLQRWPGFDFFVRRRNYTNDIRLLKQDVRLNQPVTLLINSSEYHKKLQKSSPLTFGDKYVNYYVVQVFGANQGKHLHIRTEESPKPLTHTNPLQRSFLFGILFLFCWTGWVYVDQHKILRPT
ncbi:hypothetical protein [Spirosoma daeguense]